MTNTKLNVVGLLRFACTLAVIGVMPAAGQNATESVLYNFTPSTGSYPKAGVILDAEGNLYGTAEHGGPAGHGVVYKLDPAGQETVLGSFTLTPDDGGWPESGLIRDSAGNLYGTTYYGGVAYAGELYKLDPAGQETELHGFTGGDGGGTPEAGVVLDPAGNLYGTACKCDSTGDYGVIYKLDTVGEYTVLHTFSGADGGVTVAGVVLDSAGNLYGTTSDGGASNMGVVYKLDTAGQLSVLHSFTGGADGGTPYAGVILDPVGNLYGTTYFGGAANLGVVYKVNTAGQLTVLHTFTGGAGGNEPYAGVTLDPAGNLYGATYYGGTKNHGVVYKLSKAGYTVLHSFSGSADGANPYAGVILDSAGNLYGTTYFGGTAEAGVVFKVSP